ncbi:amino acid transporter [Microbacterium sp.]|uniref:amino acid transporter n=1 Tax=Microbacterium sp. TaxID=51671 RepID=UPI0039E6A992
MSEPNLGPRPATRRDLMKPVQLLGLAFAAAVFGGGVALVSMGFFTDLPAPEPGELEPHLRIAQVAGVVAGISFIATLVIIALLMLAVDPAEITREVDHGVLLDENPAEGAADAAAPASDDDTAPRD